VWPDHSWSAGKRVERNDTAGGLFDIIVRELKSKSLINEGVYKIFTWNSLIENQTLLFGLRLRVRSRKGPFIESHPIVAAGAAVIWSPITRRIIYS
jgi:hypothetical protein